MKSLASWQREITEELSSKYFTIMLDETTDQSNTEQMVFSLRYVDDDLEVHEEFIGLYNLDSTSADSIFAAIKKLPWPMLRWCQQHVRM